MILTCPACGTQYVVKDGAIPEGGRKVRCASCRHSWHQEATPHELDEPGGTDDAIRVGGAVASGPADEPVEAPLGAEHLAEEAWQAGEEARAGETDPVYVEPDPPPAAPVEALAGRESEDEQGDIDRLAEERAAIAPIEREPGDAILAPARSDDDYGDFSPFAARREDEPRRRRPLLTVLLIVILVALAAAAFWFLAPPELKARIGLAESSQTPLQLMMTSSDREALASGNELLAVSGRVINPTSRTQPVPPIQAELRSKTGEIVYRWTIAPPTPMLAPGASARFNSAEVNVPAGGEELTVSLGAPSA